VCWEKRKEHGSMSSLPLAPPPAKHWPLTDESTILAHAEEMENGLMASYYYEYKDLGHWELKSECLHKLLSSQ
jgi:hypothetical protein